MSRNGAQSIVLVGNLESPPEIRYDRNGKARTDLRLVIDEEYVDKHGKTATKREILPLVVVGKDAEPIASLPKGAAICFQGYLHSRAIGKNARGYPEEVQEIVGEDVRAL